MVVNLRGNNIFVAAMMRRALRNRDNETNENCIKNGDLEKGLDPKSFYSRSARNLRTGGGSLMKDSSKRSVLSDKTNTVVLKENTPQFKGTSRSAMGTTGKNSPSELKQKSPGNYRGISKVQKSPGSPENGHLIGENKTTVDPNGPLNTPQSNPVVHPGSKSKSRRKKKGYIIPEPVFEKMVQEYHASLGTAGPRNSATSANENNSTSRSEVTRDKRLREGDCYVLLENLSSKSTPKPSSVKRKLDSDEQPHLSSSTDLLKTPEEKVLRAASKSRSRKKTVLSEPDSVDKSNRITLRKRAPESSTKPGAKTISSKKNHVHFFTPESVGSPLHQESVDESFSLDGSRSSSPRKSGRGLSPSSVTSDSSTLLSPRRMTRSVRKLCYPQQHGHGLDAVKEHPLVYDSPSSAVDTKAPLDLYEFDEIDDPQFKKKRVKQKRKKKDLDETFVLSGDHRTFNSLQRPSMQKRLRSYRNPELGRQTVAKAGSKNTPLNKASVSSQKAAEVCEKSLASHSEVSGINRKRSLASHNEVSSITNQPVAEDGCELPFNDAHLRGNSSDAILRSPSLRTRASSLRRKEMVESDKENIDYRSAPSVHSSSEVNIRNPEDSTLLSFLGTSRIESRRDISGCSFLSDASVQSTTNNSMIASRKPCEQSSTSGISSTFLPHISRQPVNTYRMAMEKAAVQKDSVKKSSIKEYSINNNFGFDEDPEIDLLFSPVGRPSKQVSASSSQLRDSLVASSTPNIKANPPNARPTRISPRLMARSAFRRNFNKKLLQPPSQASDVNRELLQPPSQASDVNRELLQPPSQASDVNRELLQPPSQASDMNKELLQPPTEVLEDPAAVLIDLKQQVSELKKELAELNASLSPRKTSVPVSATEVRGEHPVLEKRMTTAQPAPAESLTTLHDQNESIVRSCESASEKEPSLACSVLKSPVKQEIQAAENSSNHKLFSHLPSPSREVESALQHVEKEQPCPTLITEEVQTDLSVPVSENVSEVLLSRPTTPALESEEVQTDITLSDLDESILLSDIPDLPPPPPSGDIVLSSDSSIESPILYASSPIPDSESPHLFDGDLPIHFRQAPRKSYEGRAKRARSREPETSEDEAHEGESHKGKKKKTKHDKEEEKELEKWAQQFNAQCEDIEHFDLCVE